MEGKIAWDTSISSMNIDKGHSLKSTNYKRQIIPYFSLIL